MLQLDRCPACNSTSTAFDYEGVCRRTDDGGRPWSVTVCQDCGLRFLNPQPEWSDLSPYYDKSYSAYAPDHGTGGVEAEIARAKAAGEYRHVRITPGMKVLDVGCGGGSFLQVVRGLGGIPQGVEPSEAGFRSTSAAGLPVFHGQLHEFIASGQAERYDLITASHVVEHHPEPVRMIQEMYSLLAPGGRLWFAVPNGETPDALALRDRWHSTDLPFHLTHFGPRSMAKALERAGIADYQLETYSLPDAVEASIQARLRWGIGLPVRISRHLPLGGIARKRGGRLDRENRGESILVNAIAPAEAGATPQFHGIAAE
ncbi:hypothetical protein ACFB49_04610 [Sphingomonas sp. DBB INV C78]|uniref:methyltransferase domain-containing protein n=1 Tax=Sphingomonas sp. DBB INV C78 TaxID=3349434 RepID=UPI0036D32F38